MAPVHADSVDSSASPFQDSHSKEVLRAMSGASTWGHPDQAGEFEGILRFANGDYVTAMQYFLDGARYADKPSQLCIGLMYLNGNGVPKDPVRAYAWLAIAAERNYPTFVATRDKVWADLSTDQRREAAAWIKKLSSEYGDAVAKPRMVAQLGQNMLQGTQSHVGFDDGRMETLYGNPFDWNSPSSCAVSSIGGAPVSGCRSGIAGSSLKKSNYFRSRDAEWQALVTVGPLQTTNAPEALSGSSSQKIEHP